MFLSKLCLLLLQPAHTHDAPYGSLPHRPSCIACHEAQIRTAALRANASPLGEHLGSPHPQRTVNMTGNSLPQLKLLTRKVVILKLPAVVVPFSSKSCAPRLGDSRSTRRTRRLGADGRQSGQGSCEAWDAEQKSCRTETTQLHKIEQKCAKLNFTRND